MSRTYKDYNKWEDEPLRAVKGRKRPRFPRVPSIRKRSEPFELVDRDNVEPEVDIKRIQHLDDIDQ